MWVLCIKDKELLGPGLHDLEELPMQLLASKKNFPFSFKGAHVGVSGELILQHSGGSSKIPGDRDTRTLRIFDLFLINSTENRGFLG